MSKARLVITALFMEHQSPAEVAQRSGVHRAWVYKLRARYEAEGDAALVPRSRRPKSSPTATAPATVQVVLRLRKQLAEAGLERTRSAGTWPVTTARTAHCRTKPPCHRLQHTAQATPGASRDNDTHDRVRHDKIDGGGAVTLRVNGRLHHIGIGRTHARTPVILLVQDLDVRIVNAATGELLRELTIDPRRDYQPTGQPPRPRRHHK
ncbi:MAG: Integrase catalytic region [Pseudonocardiales bacterium]|nr:Integrase catalytic region [Pseudonocardiales bacterium]